MTRAQHLLQCALTYRAAEPREEPLVVTFDSATQAVAEFMRVLLHEARESMQTPMRSLPDPPMWHPVDVETDEPGIIDRRGDDVQVVRMRLPQPRVTYTARPGRAAETGATAESPFPSAHSRDAGEVETVRTEAAATVAGALKEAEKRAAADEKRKARQEQTRTAREAETEADRTTRLAAGREKRAAAKAKREAEAESSGGAAAENKKPRASAPPAPPPSEDAMAEVDTSSGSLWRPSAPKPRNKDAKVQFYESPVPHHRHLEAMQSCAPSAALLPALLLGSACDALEIIQGPPGTGKTRALVQRLASIPAAHRVLLCAPTNVGAANLYARCVSDGYGNSCALALASDRVPLGTTVLSNDVSRRLVCATISARAGPFLHAQSFDAVFVDEAAQCMEAWVWTLLRPEVELLVLAGDVRQLPAQVSDSGKTLRHERSLMERLVVDLTYDNAITLTEQNRMAPELLAFPNAEFYDGSLTTGPHAPASGRVRVVHADRGAEEACGTSWCNRAEAATAAAEVRRLATTDGTAVLLAPYAAQCKLLLAQRTGYEVHTVDSFQGREADTVVLCVVRDGSSGFGFWADYRRLVVALTRARRNLVLVVSSAGTWPRESILARLVQQTAGESGPSV